MTMKRIGVLLTNTGTPDAPTPSAVKRFLAEFLSDPHIVRLPKLLWLPILHTVILPLRAKKSAALYEKIWATDSPMRLHMQALAQKLSVQMSSDDEIVTVQIGMNYGNPSLADGLGHLLHQGVDEIIVLPLYPQYSHTTTSASLDHIDRLLKPYQNLPPIHKIQSYATHPAYIQALATQMEHHWETHGRCEHLLISYHGIPEQFVKAGDPYQQECEATTQALTHALNLRPEDYTHCYQSKFGYAAWLKPSTQTLFQTLPQRGIKSLDVICPGFAVDCLETLDEIALAGREEFIKSGGAKLNYLPALNESAAHTLALAQIIKT